MIRAVIIDDEEHNIANLKALLRCHCPQISVTGQARNVDSGLELIQNQCPDLLFLDIQMPGKTGFDLLTSLIKPSFEVIFVTGFDQYGIQAIRFSAIDYLLKPIDIPDLKAAVARAVDKITEKQQNVKVQNLVQLLLHSQQKMEHRIALSSARETRFVKTGEIIRCVADNNYTLFFLTNGEELLVSKPMFEYEEMLKEYGFVRPHHSHLVNVSYIKSLIKEDSGYLMMIDGSKVPVSRLRKESVKKVLML